MANIVLIPVYNEQESISQILDSLPAEMIVILIDDASQDRSPEIMVQWCKQRSNRYLIRFSKNRGKSKAMIAGFAFVLHLQALGKVSSTSILVAMDGDGQHQAAAICQLIEVQERHNYGMVIGCRDLSNYPAYKVLGNRLLSATASLVGGTPFQDVECGLRGIRLNCLAAIVPYLTGFRYSLEQEISVLAARSNSTLNNDFPVTIPIFKSNTCLLDAVLNISGSLLAVGRLMCGIKGGNRQFTELDFTELLASGAITVHTE